MGEGLELRVLKVLAEAEEKGMAWVRARIAQLETDMVVHEPGAFGRLMQGWSAPPKAQHLANALTLGEAVVAAIEHLGRFSTSRDVVDAVRTFPTIAMEQDERQKRRKVSQALYVQRGPTLVSHKMGRRTLWGKRDWLTPTATMKIERFPLPMEVNQPDDDEDND